MNMQEFAPKEQAIIYTVMAEYLTRLEGVNLTKNGYRTGHEAVVASIVFRLEPTGESHVASV